MYDAIEEGYREIRARCYNTEVADANVEASLNTLRCPLAASAAAPAKAGETVQRNDHQSTTVQANSRPAHTR